MRNKSARTLMTATLMAGLVCTGAMAQETQLRDRDPDGRLRFHMTQNGKQMTADDFEAWLAQKGVRVSGGKTVWAQQPIYAQPQGGQDAGGPPLRHAGLSVLLPADHASSSPLPTAAAPVNRPQYDSGGQLTGYDSSWSGGGVVVRSTGNSPVGRTNVSSQATVSSYDSGRDY